MNLSSVKAIHTKHGGLAFTGYRKLFCAKYHSIVGNKYLIGSVCFTFHGERLNRCFLIFRIRERGVFLSPILGKGDILSAVNLCLWSKKELAVEYAKSLIRSSK